MTQFESDRWVDGARRGFVRGGTEGTTRRGGAGYDRQSLNRHVYTHTQIPRHPLPVFQGPFLTPPPLSSAMSVSSSWVPLGRYRISSTRGGGHLHPFLAMHCTKAATKKESDDMETQVQSTHRHTGIEPIGKTGSIDDISQQVGRQRIEEREGGRGGRRRRHAVSESFSPALDSFLTYMLLLPSPFIPRLISNLTAPLFCESRSGLF